MPVSTTVENTPLVSTVEPFTPSTLLDEGVTRSSSSTTVRDFFGNLTEVLLAATTEAHRAEAPEAEGPPDHDPDDDADGVDVDAAQRRNLLIGVICLTVALVLLLGAIGYFFYRV